MQGDHSKCIECSGRYSPPPCLKDMPQPPTFTNEMREYVNFWEDNMTSPRNPQTRRALKKCGRVWNKCNAKYYQYKELQDPSVAWRNAKLQIAQEAHAEPVGKHLGISLHTYPSAWRNPEPWTRNLKPCSWSLNGVESHGIRPLDPYSAFAGV